MRSIFPFPWMWVLPAWGLLTGIYFQAAYAHIWKQTGVNLWLIWWRTSANNLKTERRFAEEIVHFPGWKLGYQIIKWGTLIVVVGYIAITVVLISHRMRG